MNENWGVHRTLLQPLEILLNRALALDPATHRGIASLAGQVLVIESSLPPLTLAVTCGASGNLSLSPEPPATGGNIRLRGTAIALAALLTSLKAQTSFAGSGVEVQGDVHLLQQLRNLLQNLDMDWEAALANMIGDVPAHLLCKSLRHAQTWQQQARERAGSGLASFLQEEARLTPSPAEVQQFTEAVRRLAADTDRLSARLEPLKKRIIH